MNLISGACKTAIRMCLWIGVSTACIVAVLPVSSASAKPLKAAHSQTASVSVAHTINVGASKAWTARQRLNVRRFRTKAIKKTRSACHFYASHRPDGVCKSAYVRDCGRFRDNPQEGTCMGYFDVLRRGGVTAGEGAIWGKQLRARIHIYPIFWTIEEY